VKYRLMDLLACPIDKTFPLKLIVFSEKTYERSLEVEGDKPVCEEYCGLNRVSVKGRSASELGCERCVKLEVVEGILICPKCLRWYPIMDEIPSLLPDELREGEKEEELEFLRRYRDRIPREVLVRGKPFNLSGELEG